MQVEDRNELTLKTFDFLGVMRFDVNLNERAAYRDPFSGELAAVASILAECDDN